MYLSKWALTKKKTPRQLTNPGGCTDLTRNSLIGSSCTKLYPLQVGRFSELYRFALLHQRRRCTSTPKISSCLDERIDTPGLPQIMWRVEKREGLQG